MIIQIDNREQDLLTQINILISIIPLFKDIKIETHCLPIGDVLLFNEETKETDLIIERKSINDLLASIKDGRYEEQSYRLNGLKKHNHNIIYLIEGDVNKMNRFKDNKMEKLTIYSAIFSLNYYKGFSVIRTFTIEESAIFICNAVIKLSKERNGKKAFYTAHIINETNETTETTETTETKETKETKEESDKDYIGVVKKVKKDNITADNIDEIMLCQIPGISAASAIAIMQKFKTLTNLLKELEHDDKCLKDIATINAKGQSRKINKTCSVNIVKYLLKK
jgi:ERCC4-type nuclease